MKRWTYAEAHAVGVRYARAHPTTSRQQLAWLVKQLVAPSDQATHADAVRIAERFNVAPA